MVNSVELIGTTEYLTLQARCHINRCRYNRVQLYYVTSNAESCRLRKRYVTYQFQKLRVHSVCETKSCAAKIEEVGFEMRNETK
jgi:hypothetical protein